MGIGIDGESWYDGDCGYVIRMKCDGLICIVGSVWVERG